MYIHFVHVHLLEDYIIAKNLQWSSDGEMKTAIKVQFICWDICHVSSNQYQHHICVCCSIFSFACYICFNGCLSSCFSVGQGFLYVPFWLCLGVFSMYLFDCVLVFSYIIPSILFLQISKSQIFRFCNKSINTTCQLA